MLRVRQSSEMCDCVHLRAYTSDALATERDDGKTHGLNTRESGSGCIKRREVSQVELGDRRCKAKVTYRRLGKWNP